MGNDRIVRIYQYKGKELGKLIEFGTGSFRDREFRADLTEYEAIDLVNNMSPTERVHMKHNAYAVYRLLESYGLNPDDYVNDEDVMIHVTDKGYKTLTELARGDHRAWELIIHRSLEKELFEAFQIEKK